MSSRRILQEGWLSSTAASTRGGVSLTSTCNWYLFHSLVWMPPLLAAAAALAAVAADARTPLSSLWWTARGVPQANQRRLRRLSCATSRARRLLGRSRPGASLVVGGVLLRVVAVVVVWVGGTQRSQPDHKRRARGILRFLFLAHLIPTFGMSR